VGNTEKQWDSKTITCNWGSANYQTGGYTGFHHLHVRRITSHQFCSRHKRLGCIVRNWQSKIHQMPSTHTGVMITLLPIPMNNSNFPQNQLDEQRQTRDESLNTVHILVLLTLIFQHNPRPGIWDLLRSPTMCWCNGLLGGFQCPIFRYFERPQNLFQKLSNRIWWISNYSIQFSPFSIGQLPRLNLCFPCLAQCKPFSSLLGLFYNLLWCV
jgi:hypothetical protein